MHLKTAVRIILLPFCAVLLQPGTARAVTAGSEIEIARGIALVNDGLFRDAVEPLERALAAEPRNQEALFYAGVAHSRLAEYPAAGALLQRALAVAEAAEVFFELGRVRALTGNCAEAGRLFSRSEAMGGDEAGRRAAELLLLGCSNVPMARRLRLVSAAGWQYDSNVILEPAHPTAPKSTKADQRALLYVAAEATPLKAETLALDIGYSFYGNLHGKLTQYNAIVQRVRAELAFTAWERVRPAFGYSLDYSLFDGKSFNLTHRGTLQATLREGEGATTAAVIEVRDARFWNSVLFGDNADRTGDGESAGLRQRLVFGPVETKIELFADRDRAREAWWATDGWRAAAKALWRPAPALALTVSGEYQTHAYDAPYPGQQVLRDDRTLTLAASLSWSFNRTASLTLSESWTRNDSNLALYDYTRNIAGAYLTIALGR
ncbi:MAG: tetratricopeptide repeat protein [Candidatus Methylomirabilia bacterium]